MNKLEKSDLQVYEIIKKEKNRQTNTITLIASENYIHEEVLEAISSEFTNKYAEGYPGKRFYSGCQFADEIELLAIARCKELYGVEHVNVQPHSGSSANMAIYMSVLKPGDTIMGMNFASGGHLTHGHKLNFSGYLYNIIEYNVDKKTEYLDYENIEKLAYTYKPKLIIAGSSSYSREIDFEKFSYIAKSVNAYLMTDIAHLAGLIAAKLHKSPVGYADFITATTHKTLRGPRSGFIMSKEKFQKEIDKAVMPGIQGGPFMNIIAGKATTFALALKPEFKEYQKQVLLNSQAISKKFIDLGYKIISGGTDNHMFVVDLRSKNITGKLAEEILEKAGINVSRSSIPFDTQSPYITSGIRIGTYAITTLGFNEQNAIDLACKIDKILSLI